MTNIRRIPGTAGFLASDEGVIYDPNGRVRTQYKNGDGYATASVLVEGDNGGRWQTFGVHRLVAKAHLPCNGDSDDYQINHRDHDISNNHASNLEWSTDSLNNIHAAEFIRVNKLSKKAVTVDLKNNKLRENNGWWYLYHTAKNRETLKSVMDRPGEMTA